MEGLRKLRLKNDRYIRKQRSRMYEYLLVKLACIILIQIFTNQIDTYANWYEEPLAIERTNYDNAWWLSKKKKASLREKEEEEIAKKREEYKNRDFKDKNIKWLYDDNNITRFPRSKWEVIDDDGDNIGYEYYFDEEGYLLIDTVTPDYEIVDEKGRRVDNILKPIVHIISETENVDEEVIVKNVSEIEKKSNAEVIITEGVVFREKVKVYDNSINKEALLYIDTSSRFTKETKGTTVENIKWKKCSSIRGGNSYLILNNPNNNFNKISFVIAFAYYTDIKEDESFRIAVYDADVYDEHKKNNTLYDIEEIYQISSIDGNKQQKISFTFNKSINRLRMEVEVIGEGKSRNLLIKDMKYGFSKEAYRNEIIEKMEREKEIEEVKRLGIYDNILYSLDFMDEDGEEIEEDEESDNDKEIKDNDYDEYGRTYEDEVRDRVTGPAFDEDLKKATSDRDYGPAFVIVSSKSELE